MAGHKPLTLNTEKVLIGRFNGDATSEGTEATEAGKEMLEMFDASGSEQMEGCVALEGSAAGPEPVTGQF